MYKTDDFLDEILDSSQNTLFTSSILTLKALNSGLTPYNSITVLDSNL